jgi:hypothetical protein
MNNWQWRSAESRTASLGQHQAMDLSSGPEVLNIANKTGFGGLTMTSKPSFQRNLLKPTVGFHARDFHDRAWIDHVHE